MDSSMVFPHLSYPPPPPPPNMTTKPPRQGSPTSSPSCEQLGGLLPYTPPIPSAPEGHLMGLYTPTYAAAQSRLFSTGFAGPPVSSGPESPTSALYSGLAPPPNPASMSSMPSMSSMYNSQAAAAAAAWRAHPPSLASHQPPCGPYDHHGWHPAYTYAHNSSIDLNSARRKNATRESTATLKAWLQEHIKNPYPTKGEKIMLAIITKMTLTQVSTWFANARRRLKKENKMTWSPRNRGEEDAKESEDESLSADNKSDYGRGSEMTPLTAVSDTPEPKYPVVHPTVGAPFEGLEERPKIWSLANTAACSPVGLSKPAVGPEEAKPFFLPP